MYMCTSVHAIHVHIHIFIYIYSRAYTYSITLELKYNLAVDVVLGAASYHSHWE